VPAPAQVDPQFFAFRWITLLLTQEFSFPDAMRIWDTLLSDAAGRTDCLLRVCCAMLLHVKPQLVAGDFSMNVKLLQRFPSVDINVILGQAAALAPCASVLGQPL
jgi:TBC1 domain family member 13